jgi:xanthine dehydrogenase accessory factor
MAADEDNVLEKALDWLDEKRSVAIATVVETWGSSPRPRGSQLAIRDDGLFVGSVSGGCVEGRVVEAGLLAMQDKKHRLLEFGVSDHEAWGVGLACGGTVRILVAPAPDRTVLETVRTARKEQRGIVVYTPLSDGRATTEALVLGDAAARALATDEAATVETANGPVFVQAFNPARKLVIVGAVHIAEPLAKIASVLGYAITIIDPRAAFARAERWPGLEVFTDYPDEIMATMTINHRTAIVALTHDPKIDDPALEAALKSTAFYIGALGSMKTHGSRIHRLAERGFSENDLARIHGPIGLKIGARSPGEIAVAIAAQITESLRRAARA